VRPSQQTLPRAKIFRVRIILDLTLGDEGHVFGHASRAVVIGAKHLAQLVGLGHVPLECRNAFGV
jgi:molybdenum cofactor biosynthesis enzyme